MPEPEKINISIVNYANTLPFKWALKRSEIAHKINLQEDIPSICAQKLKYKQVELALVPVALIPELGSYFIESDYCIGANGKVDSVKLYSAVPLEDIKEVALDYQSKTSVNLVKVLFRFFWKKEVKFTDTTPGYEHKIGGNHAAVVIGDRTFQLNGQFKHEYDLAEEWKKFTGLPFVFAAWVSTEELAENFIQEFNAVLKYGIENIDKSVVEENLPTGVSKDQIKKYLVHFIDYKFDDSKRKALRLFLDYMKKLTT